MPGVDWIPGVAHIKATAQILTGDKEGAAETIGNFHKECPGVSQVTSIVQLAQGDLKGAKETQKRCLGTLSNLANGTPVVGHFKGAVHHLAGDHEGRDRAINAANRSSVVLGAGIAAGVATGGAASIHAGVAAGVCYDATASRITGKEQGCFAGLRRAFENPSAATIIDAIVIPIGDGVAGYSGGQIGEQLSNAAAQTQSVGTQAKLSSLESARAAKLDILNGELGKTAATGKGMTTGEIVGLGNDIKSLTAEISLIKDGTPKYWTDLKPVTPQTPSVTVPVVGCYDKDNEGITKLGTSITGTVKLLPDTTASLPPDDPRFPEKNTEINKNLQPWDYSLIGNYIYQQQQSIFKLWNREKPKEDPPTYVASRFLDETSDAIYYDSYIKNSWNDLFIEHYNYQTTQNILKLFNNEKATEDLNLKLVPLFPTENLIKVRNLNNRKPNDPKKDVEERELDRMQRASWLHLNLPEDLFSYTAFVQLNNDNEGLYHSLIRHLDQWMEFVPFDQELIDRLNPIMNEITQIVNVNADSNFIRGLNTPESSRVQAAEVREITKEIKRKLRQALKNLSKEDFQNITRALLRIQILMYDFLESNVTSSTYIRTVTNADHNVQLHFKVKTKTGETKVMVVCVSKEIYNPVKSVDKRKVRTVKTIFFRPWYEDALFYDSYVKNSWDDVGSKYSKEQQESILNFRDNQKPTSSLDLLSVRLLLKGTLMLIRTCNSAGTEPPGHLLYWYWLHLNLPQEDFSYTTLIQLNNDNDGLLHSLIRHIDQWREFINVDQRLINRLDPIINEIEELFSVIEGTSTSDSENVTNQAREAREKAEKARDKLRDVLKKLSKDAYRDIKRALLRIQILFYDFLENNVTSSQYIGRTVTADGLEQLHFKVKTLTGETKVMTICVSVDLYEPDLSVEERPIRKVITIFFKSLEDSTDIFET